MWYSSALGQIYLSTVTQYLYQSYQPKLFISRWHTLEILVPMNAQPIDLAWLLLQFLAQFDAHSCITSAGNQQLVQVALLLWIFYIGTSIMFKNIWYRSFSYIKWLDILWLHTSTDSKLAGKLIKISISKYWFIAKT